MMGQFLDGLGIAREEGTISNEAMMAPTQERLAAAAGTLARSFPVRCVL
jgi:hypothetical protein